MAEKSGQREWHINCARLREVVGYWRLGLEFQIRVRCLGFLVLRLAARFFVGKRSKLFKGLG